MKKRLATLYTLVGCACFLAAGFCLATGRFGGGVFLLVLCVVFLASAMRASRRVRGA